MYDRPGDSKPRHNPIRRLLAAASLAFSLSISGAMANDIEYRLQPGDRLSLTLLELPMDRIDVAIGPGGQVAFPYLGVFDVAGLTLSEARDELELRATGLDISVPNASQGFVILSGNDIFLEVSAYRPVTIIGDVVSPGAIDYVPGTTVRAIVGVAGGTASLEQVGGQIFAMEAPARLRSAVERLRVLQAEILRNSILMDRMSGETGLLPEDTETISEIVGPEDAARMIEQAGIRLRDLTRQRNSLLGRVDLVGLRVEALDAALQNYTEASDAEEERLTRMLEMADRGLATADRVDNARVAALAASTRLLTVEGDIFEARAELERLRGEIDGLEDEFRNQILGDNSDLARQVGEISGRIAGLRDVVMLTDPMAAVDLDAVIDVVVYRGAGDNERVIEADMADTVLPGDIVEVRVQAVSQ